MMMRERSDLLIAKSAPGVALPCPEVALSHLEDALSHLEVGLLCSEVALSRSKVPLPCSEVALSPEGQSTFRSAPPIFESSVPHFLSPPPLHVSAPLLLVRAVPLLVSPLPRSVSAPPGSHLCPPFSSTTRFNGHLTMRAPPKQHDSPNTKEIIYPCYSQNTSGHRIGPATLNPKTGIEAYPRQRMECPPEPMCSNSPSHSGQTLAREDLRTLRVEADETIEAALQMRREF